MLRIYPKVRQDEANRAELEVSRSGSILLEEPLLNKGSAFSQEEREDLGLLGLLPYHASSIEEQLQRSYENYTLKQTDIERYLYLLALQDRNETLYYRLLEEHITEMMPIIYTPVVGDGCKYYSHVYNRARGLYISYPYRDRIDQILDNAPIDRTRVIVVTDGERILGLGDLGVGGMGIPVGKLSLYTLCAGIHPATTLPILLDVGTDNKELLNDPLYLGWRHERIRGEEYDSFINDFVEAVKRKIPGALLQWEDFAKHNAGRLLDKYRDDLCTFNDDIQGTGAVALSGLLAAQSVTGQRLRDQQVLIMGAGSSATGITRQIVTAMKREGLTEAEAKARVWLVDSQGLVHTGRTELEEFKKEYAQPLIRTATWRVNGTLQHSLEHVVKNIRPSILLGTSAQPGAFTEGMIREMARHCERPIIFPLSNPNSKCEAIPSDLIEWTDGRAIIATGSPFAPVQYEGNSYEIGQCNNAYIFPGVGLGILASGARRVTDEMFVAAAYALSELSPAHADPHASLFPPLERVREIARKVAFAVALEAQRQGHAEATSPDELLEHIEANMWRPEYPRYVAGGLVEQE